LLGIKDIENLIDPAALAAVQKLENSGISEVGIKNAKMNHAVALRTAERLQKRKQEEETIHLRRYSKIIQRK
jgi:hypothetical protein